MSNLPSGLGQRPSIAQMQSMPAPARPLSAPTLAPRPIAPPATNAMASPVQQPYKPNPAGAAYTGPSDHILGAVNTNPTGFRPAPIPRPAPVSTGIPASQLGPGTLGPSPSNRAPVAPMLGAPQNPVATPFAPVQQMPPPPAGFPDPSGYGSMMLSDVNAKSDVRRESAADGFLASLTPHSYRYTDPSDEPTSEPSGGRYLGILAQNVERSPTGDTIVKDTPRGKMLEGHALMSALAAGEGRLHERLKALETQRKK